MLLPRPFASALAAQPVASVTDIRRGAAPGAVCVPPGMFNICITSELTAFGGAWPLAPFV